MKFERLISKYSKEYEVTHITEGELIDGVWHDGEKIKYQVNAAIFPVRAEEVKRYEGLGYTTKDIKIFIPSVDGEVDALNLKTEEYEMIEIEENDRIKYMGDIYVFDSVNNRTTHSDFIKWIAKRDQAGDSND